ncbi:TetR/AcrR family transcriptional regulator [Sedimentibacter sp.]|uniref:TetR/AcrR family transcriptional regulator n=1 Tax=Sedimentibacter sp. TaxID=1960295 RepID=UPI0028AB1B74|nr:TetR/AcrR family transcriptional regulator [Sedimentibacter sp.]
MNGYEKRTKLKKEAIINSARELFIKRGVTDVSISEIAAKANVSQVSIYNYFGDKISLAKEVLISYIDTLVNEYNAILEDNISFEEKLEIIITKKYDALTNLGKTSFSSSAWKDKALKDIYTEAANLKIKSIFTKFIQNGKEKGYINKDMPDDAILSFMTASSYIIQQPNYISTSDDYKLGIIKLFLYGLVGKEK